MFLPLLIEMKGRKVLIVGGGKVALRRAKTLSEAEADITVIAPAYIEGWEDIAASRHHRPYEPGDAVGFDLVCAATDSAAANDAVRKDCAENGIPLNDAVDGDSGDVIFPGVVREGGYTAAIASGGKTPFLTKKIKNDIREVLSAYDAELVSYLASVRAYIIENHPEETETLLRKLAALSPSELREKGDPHDLTDRLQREPAGPDPDEADGGGH